MTVLTLPDGQVADFGDMPPDQIRSLIQKKYPNEVQNLASPMPPSQATTPPDASFGDYAAAVGRGLGRGLGHVPGILGDTFEATVGGLDWVHNQFSGPNNQIHTPIPGIVHAISGEGINQAVSEVAGAAGGAFGREGKAEGLPGALGLPGRPVDLGTSKPGGPQAAETIAGFVAPAVTLGAGAGSIRGALAEAAPNAMKQGVIPGLATVAMQETGNPVLTALAPVVAGGGIQAAERGKFTKSTQAIHDEAGALMDASKQHGYAVAPRGMNRIVQYVSRAADDANLPAEIQADSKKVAASTAVEKHVSTYAGKPALLSDVHLLRQRIDRAIGEASSKTDKRIAVQMKRAFDKALTDVAQNKETGTIGRPGAPRMKGAAQAIGVLKEGIAKYAQAERAGVLDRIVTRAEKESTVPGEYSKNLLKGFKALSLKFEKDPKAAGMFSPTERAAIDKIAKGGNIERTMRWLAKMNPNSALLYSVGAGGGLGAAAFQSGMSPGMVGAVLAAPTIAVGTGKIAGKIGQSALLRRRAALTSAAIRGGRLPGQRGGLGTSEFLRGTMATSPPPEKQ